MDMPIEDRFLLHCSKLNMGESDSELEVWLSSPISWDDILQKASLHNVSPLLYRNLIAYEQRIPEHVFKSLKSSYYANLIRNEVGFKELSRLLKAFKDDDIDAILLKGVALTEDVYRDPALRIMVDADILVKKEDLSRAESKLDELGYIPSGSRVWTRRFSNLFSLLRKRLNYARKTKSYSTHQPLIKSWHHLTPYISPDKSIMVEIHSDITPSFSDCHIDIDQFWIRAKKIQFSGIGTLALSPEDLIIHLCLHISLNHRFDVRLIQLCDICEAIRSYKEVDWEYINKTAVESGASRSIYHVLLTSKRLLNAEVPDRALKNLNPQPNRDDESMVEKICESILAKDEEINISYEIPRMLQDLMAAEKISDSAKILIRLTFPSRQFMQALYSLPSNSRMVYLYYLVRPFDLTLKLVRLGLIFIGKPKSVISVFRRRKAIIRKSLR